MSDKYLKGQIVTPIKDLNIFPLLLDSIYYSVKLRGKLVFSLFILICQLQLLYIQDS